MNAKIIDIINATQDALIRKDLGAYLAHLAADVTMQDPIAPPVHGLDAAREHLERMVAQMGEVAFLERKIFAVGKSAAMKYTLKITIPGGPAATVEGVDVFDLDEDNKIKRIASYWNPTDLAPAAR